MAEDFSITAVPLGDLLEVSIGGSITENSPLRVDESHRSLPVHLNLSRIHGINAFGVRSWVGFIRQLCIDSPAVSIQQLPPVFVRNFGIVADFLACAKVESFLVPWVCLDCGHEDTSLHRPGDLIPSVRVCGACSANMNLDDIRHYYEDFASPT